MSLPTKRNIAEDRKPLGDVNGRLRTKTAKLEKKTDAAKTLSAQKNRRSKATKAQNRMSIGNIQTPCIQTYPSIPPPSAIKKDMDISRDAGSPPDKINSSSMELDLSTLDYSGVTSNTHDIDRVDCFDPQWVTEYVSEIYKNLRISEKVFHKQITDYAKGKVEMKSIHAWCTCGLVGRSSRRI
eukprot:TRINITY_DN1210_c0_g1_i2.p2 TRINITY_DN1210_c0_g1~~TRINITY_DN1210_c0_g1_i2.p2  ORF type:complete len:183 (-),score=38.34 TRINITY_DN1210_c0_g1_i2:780-1328(-)